MKYFIAIFVTAVIVFVGATVYYKGMPSFPAYPKNPFSTQSGIPAGSTETLATPSPTADTATIESLIKAALVAKHGATAQELTVKVSKIEGEYAEGGASGQGGGGMWFAARLNGTWTLVWDGNGQIDCKDISPYPGFPADMIPECWDSTTGKTVAR